MITLIASIAFAASTTGDGSAPVKTAAQLLEDRLGACESELNTARQDLTDCGNKLVEQARVRTQVRPPAAAPPAPPAPPAPAEDEAPPAPEPELPELPSVEDMQFDLSPAPAVRIIVSQPTSTVNNYGIVPPDAPAPFTAAPTMTPSSASAGSGRYSVLIGATGGVGFAGVEPIVDASGTAVGGGLEVPLSARLGVLFRENHGIALGLLGHATIEPLQYGTSGGVDVMVLGGKRMSKIGFAIGGNYTGFQSLDSAANAWLWGGEAKAVGLVPLAGAHSRVSFNFIVEVGAKGGVLYNEDKADTTWLVDPVGSAGFVLAFGSRRLSEN